MIINKWIHKYVYNLCLYNLEIDSQTTLAQCFNNFSPQCLSENWLSEFKTFFWIQYFSEHWAMHSFLGLHINRCGGLRGKKGESYVWQKGWGKSTVNRTVWNWKMEWICSHTLDVKNWMN